MSTPQTAQVYVTNSTDGQATITLYHNNSSNGTQQGTWQAAPGQQVGPLKVPFETGWGAWGILDYWALELVVTGGSTPGVYESSGVLQYSVWKECQLQSADAGKNLGFSVNVNTFFINLDSGGCSTPMNLVQRQTAQAYVTNSTDGSATIKLFHNNSSDGTQSGSWDAAPGETVGPLTVPFRVGIDNALILDYWALELAVKNGSNPGIYQSAGFLSMTNWKECQLQAADSGRNLPLTVNTNTFAINLPSGGCQASMSYVGPYSKVSHVFVLMLENHSFDNVLGLSGIPGITHASQTDSNSYGGQTYSVGSAGAPASMPTDPGHEFLDVLEQLCFPVATHTPWQPYPQAITNAGFVANYRDHPFGDHVEQPEPAYTRPVWRRDAVLQHADAAPCDVSAGDGVRGLRPVVRIKFPAPRGQTASSSTARLQGAGPTPRPSPGTLRSGCYRAVVSSTRAARRFSTPSARQG